MCALGYDFKMDKKSKCQLYLITPARFDLYWFSERLNNALDAGSVACLQLRLKNAEDDVIKLAVETILPICHSYQIPLIMNDRPDLAMVTGCDGVHVGQADVSYKEARSIMGPDLTVGVTCKNSRHLAVEAAESGSEYVAFGAFFQTETKPEATPADLKTIQWWNETTTVPSVAIGGITVDNCKPLIESGTDFLAVIDGVWNYREGEAAAVKAFNKMFGMYS